MWIVWRRRWNGGDCDVGLYNEVDSRRNCRGDAPGTPEMWYNMQQIDMSGKLPMCRRAGNAKVRYSAAYSTGRERMLEVMSCRPYLTCCEEERK